MTSNIQLIAIVSSIRQRSPVLLGPEKRSETLSGVLLYSTVFYAMQQDHGRQEHQVRDGKAIGINDNDSGGSSTIAWCLAQSHQLCVVKGWLDDTTHSSLHTTSSFPQFRYYLTLSYCMQKRSPNSRIMFFYLTSLCFNFILVCF